MSKFDPDKHHRSSMRLKYYDYSQAGAYYITLCTYNRECLFGHIENGEMFLSEYGRIVKDTWLETAKVRPNVMIDAFIVMPNHLHGIIVLLDSSAKTGATRRVAPTKNISKDGNPFGPKPGSIGAIIGQIKSIATKRINKIRNISAVTIWQRNYYEHVIRSEDDLKKLRGYIIYNPINWLKDENYIS